MKKLMNWLKDEESGQGMVEYGLILALIAIAVIGALVVVGQKVEGIFEDVQSGLDGTDPS